MKTTKYKYFSDFNGQTVELVGGVHGMPKAEFQARFPGVKGIEFDGYRYEVA